MKKILLAIFIASILFTGIASSADTAPILPFTLYGTAQTESGESIPVGTIITATINDETFTYTITESGKIGESGTFGDKFIISPSDIPTTSLITFTIGSVQASETIDFAAGEVKTLSLTFDLEIPATPTPTSSPQPTQSTPPTQSGGIPTPIQTPPPVVESPTPIPTSTETVVPTDTATIPPVAIPTPSTPAKTPLSILPLIAGIVAGAQIIRRK